MNEQRVGGVIFFVFCALYLFFATDITVTSESTFSARTFPYILGVMGCIVSLLLIVLPSIQKTIALTQLKWSAVFAMCLAMLVYAFLLSRIGFIIATILFLNTCFIIMRERKWRHMFYTSFSLTCIFWLLLTQVLNIYLAPGSWWMG
ncbi:tripartite tricarboxylate transporter TctB family protein [Candidatus Uabimicrobium amorphum]|uniref:Tricarboxylic transport TctB n=1 Tax=Uabimicrobium amorphum TaxID=2596890 RepID=A0A5S9ITG8_UABAM|nr:tripartite tricarboxylate transporter TctB family protein [Candidatus Uabimicrobium amorphum]BBM87624.1 tricarboxylic transport TctB [Candidatus Uabimicrobium amorphum]